ncbi:MAG: S9 family peptidase [Candidatus Eiseniibacteriota bacterium]|nr:MAG: S9 family peptidase [Candidatus Eisenbacteria bacterium]
MCLLVAASVATGVLFAAASELPPLIPREVLFGNPEKASAEISPDGTRLAYVAPEEGVLNVWVKTIGKDDDRVVTKDKKRGIRFYFWAYDNEHIMYLQDSDGDENWHVYSVNLNTDVVRDLTPFPGYRAQIVEADPAFPNEMLVALNTRDERLHDVYRLDLRTGALELDTENFGNIIEWYVDPNFVVRGAATTLPDGSAQLLVRDDAQSPWRPFVTWPPEDNFCSAAALTPDGEGFYLLDSREANAIRLVAKDIQSGKETVLSSDPDYDVDELTIHPRKHHVQAVSFLKERAHWVVLDPDIQEDIEAIQKIHDGDFRLISRDDADKHWLVAFTTDAGPIPYYLYDRGSKKATFLFTNRPKLEQYTLAPMKPISFKARDGLVIHGYLTLPVGLAPEKSPMVLNVHGGPWHRDRWGYDAEAQWFANRGYACLQINFRGSTGYGKKFLNAGDREWGAKSHDDLIDGVNWAIDKGYADPERIGIYGGSYGGYAALAGAAFTPDVFACAVDVCGPSNLVTLLRSIPPYWTPLVNLFNKRVGNVETEEEFLRSRSPLFKADQIKIPLLIGQGANDPRCKQAESEQIVEALRQKGQPVEYILFEDEGHGFARPENRIKFYTAAETFLAKHLGGRAEK